MTVGIKTAVGERRRAAQQTIGANHTAGNIAAFAVDHQNVVAHGVEIIEIAAQGPAPGGRDRAHLIVEHAVAQRLGSGYSVSHSASRASRRVIPAADGRLPLSFVPSICGACMEPVPLRFKTRM